MFPSTEQIGVAAYYRWQRRAGQHGHDQDDWSAAEQDLLYALNYRVIASYRLDSMAIRYLGDPDHRVCRFCGLAEPQTTLAEPVPALPAFLGNRSLRALDQCGECHDLLGPGADAELEAFVLRLPADGVDGSSRPFVPIAAYKGLVRAALSVMPEAELQYFEDAIEWVCNPDHRFDSSLFKGLGCHVDLAPAHGSGGAWTALARRVEPEGPFPYMLHFVGTGRVVLQIHVPHCGRDEDLDGASMIVPRVSSPRGPGPDEGGDARTLVDLSSPDARREPAACAS